MDDNWIDSIWFSDIRISYRALRQKRIRHFTPRKFRAVLKAILQSRSPCIDKYKMDCKFCPFQGRCLLFLMVINEYPPYILRADDAGDERARFIHATDHAITLRLLGKAAEKAGQVMDALTDKPLISIDGPGKRSTALVIQNIANDPGLRTLRTCETFTLNGPCRMPGKGAAREMTIAFFTPFDFTYHQETLTNPDDFTFPVFMEAIVRRIKDVAEKHCGYTGRIPDVAEILQKTGEVATIRSEDFGHSKNIAPKRSSRSGGKDDEFIWGLEGLVSFAGYLEPALPFVFAGEILHVGHHSTQGLGAYRIVRIGRRD